MSAYYNENDPFAAAWLRELIKAKLIADGEVDDRSIEQVEPGDLRGFTQCHFFAGIGVWSYALRNAGWADDLECWTGSCPCQGFSASGKGEGFSDKRHLWPSWFRLISECRPHTIFGEQVASKSGLAWLDVVSADLEGADYAIGSADLCAASVGAPHIRQRLFFVANSGSERIRAARFRSLDDSTRAMQTEVEQRQRIRVDIGKRGATFFDSNAEAAEVRSRLGEVQARSGPDTSNGFGDSSEPVEPSDSNGGNASTERIQRGGEHRLREEDCGVGLGVNAEHDGHDGSEVNKAEPSSNGAQGRIPDRASQLGDNFNAEQSGLEGLVGDVRKWRGPGWLDPVTARSASEAGATRGYWADCDWWYGKDGKYRPIGPGLFPLVTGASNRMVKLRGYGNALNAEVAEAFIEAYIGFVS